MAQALLFQTTVLVLAIAAVSDLICRRIPNACVIALLACAVARMAIGFDAGGIAYDIAASLLLFLPLFFAWSRQMIGGGDVKLIVAAALLVGHRSILDFLALTAIFGGFQAFLMLLKIWAGKALGKAAEATVSASQGMERAGVSASQPTVPYGIAISIACGLTLFLRSTMG